MMMVASSLIMAMIAGVVLARWLVPLMADA